MERLGSLQGQHAAIERELQRTKLRLEAGLGREVAGALERMDFHGVLDSLPLSEHSIQRLRHMQESYETELAAAAGISDRVKACFTLLAIKRPEGVDAFSSLKSEERADILHAFGGKTSLDLHDYVTNLSLTHPHLAVCAVSMIGVLPELRDDLFHSLNFSDLEEMAQNGYKQAENEILERARGQRAYGSDSPEYYFILVAERCSEKEAERFFKEKLFECERAGASTDSLKYPIVLLAVRSRRAREEFLQKVGIEGIRQSPDFLVDVVVQEKGEERLRIAQAIAKTGVQINEEDSKRILETTEYEPYSFGAAVLLCPQLTITSSVLQRAPHGGVVKRKGYRHALANWFFDKYGDSDAMPLIANSPPMQEKLDKMLAFLKSGGWASPHHFERYAKAGGRHAVYIGAMHQAEYSKYCGDLRELKDRYRALPEEDREWVVAQIRKKIKSTRNIHDVPIGFISFALRTGTIPEFRRELEEFAEDGRDFNLSRTARVALFVHDGREEDMYGEKSHLLDPQILTSFNYSPRHNVLASLLDGGELPPRFESSFAQLSPADQEWIKAHARRILTHNSPNSPWIPIALRFVDRMNLVHEYEEEIRCLAEENHGARCLLARRGMLEFDERRVVLHLVSSVQQNPERDQREVAFLTFFSAGEKYRVLAAALEGTAFEKEGGDREQAVRDYHSLPDEEREWVDGCMRQALSNYHFQSDRRPIPWSLDNQSDGRPIPWSLDKMAFIARANIAEHFRSELERISQVKGDMGNIATGLLSDINDQTADEFVESLITENYTGIIQLSTSLLKGGGKYRVLMNAFRREYGELLDTKERVRTLWEELDGHEREWVSNHIETLFRRRMAGKTNFKTLDNAIKFVGLVGLAERFQLRLIGMAYEDRTYPTSSGGSLSPLNESAEKVLASLQQEEKSE